MRVCQSYNTLPMKYIPNVGAGLLANALGQLHIC